MRREDDARAGEPSASGSRPTPWVWKQRNMHDLLLHTQSQAPGSDDAVGCFADWTGAFGGGRGGVE